MDPHLTKGPINRFTRQERERGSRLSLVGGNKQERDEQGHASLFSIT
jgi:hypothetical protein